MSIEALTVPLSDGSQNLTDKGNRPLLKEVSSVPKDLVKKFFTFAEK